MLKKKGRAESDESFDALFIKDCGCLIDERERERETETETEIPGLFHECILIMLFALFTVLLVHMYINYNVEKNDK